MLHVTRYTKMPELPEVETIRLQLEKDIDGKTIGRVEVLSKKQFVGDPQSIIGKKIIDVERSGKILSIFLENKLFLNIHLKMTGQLLYTKKIDDACFRNTIPFSNTDKMPGKTTRVIITFSDGSGLFFNDMRKFGWMKISHQQIVPKSIDVLSPDFTLEYFKKNVCSTGRPIKIMLMDQDRIAGVGNIYANEALFIAKINPQRKSKELSDEEINKLYDAVKQVIKKGIKYKGSSAADEAYVTPEGDKGQMQNHFFVYQKEGEPCPGGCKGEIKRIKQGGRSSFYCPTCQK